MFSEAKSRMQNFIKNDFIRHAKLLIRGHGSGEIKLELQPRELGDIKYHIKLKENRVTGKIIVENDIAKDLVVKNFDQLSKQLLNEGYEIGDFTVSVEQKNTEDKNSENEQNATKHTKRTMDISEKSVEYFEHMYVGVSENVNIIA